MSPLSIRPSIGSAEFAALVEIWRTAVVATHAFLAEEHREEIEERLATEYLPAVELSVAVADGVPVGFAGVADGNLEMLFVDASRRGGGIGSALLSHTIDAHGVTKVDVNEQNPQAVGFYEHHGFVVVSRSAHDDAGRPYPLLHMRLGG